MAADHSRVQTLFHEHIVALQRMLGELAQKNRVDGLVFGSGQRQYYFEDDRDIPFKGDHHFLRVCPLDRPSLYAIFSPNKNRPQLLVLDMPTHWEQQVLLPDFVLNEFEVKKMGSPAEMKKALGQFRSCAFVGSEQGFGTPAAETLKQQLVEHRRIKTAFEVACIKWANEQAMSGHKSAEAAFRSGASEWEIYLSFLKGVEGTEFDMPYHPIVALNENGSVLHYQAKDSVIKNGRSLLIDAGFRQQCYASDITRTYAIEGGAFQDLVHQLDVIQLGLIEQLPGLKDYPQLHQLARTGISRLLKDAGIVTSSVEACLETGLVDVFFPHGVGHLLGLLVHDVGGKLPGRKDLPSYLRCHLELQPGMVFTVEPGLYFNGMLLESARTNPVYSNQVAWNQVKMLQPYGGIRIEDNVHFTGDHAENLTRGS